MRIKQCPLCHVVKSINEFYHNKKENRPQSYCKICHVNKTKQRQKTPEGRAQNVISFQKYKNEHRPRRWATKSYFMHKKAGIDIKFHVKELMTLAETTPACVFCGKNLNWQNQKTACDSPSLDNLHNHHILSSLKDVAIICHQCNRTKQNRSLSEFIAYMSQTIEHLRRLYPEEITAPRNSIIRSLQKPEISRH